MRVSYSTLVKAKRAGRATSVRVAPTGTAVSEYQVPLGNRHSLKEAGVIGLSSWSEKETQAETWAKIPRLSALCPRRIVVFDGGRGNIDRCMEFGDEFEGSAVNSTLWTSAGSPTVSAGELTIPDSAEGYLRSKTAHRGSIVGSRFKIASQSNYHGCILAGDYCGIGRHSSDGNLKFLDAAAAYGTTLAALSTGTYIRYEVQVESGSTVRARKILETSTWTTWSHNGAVKATHIGPHCVGTVGVFVFIYVRKYVANEPIAGTAQPNATNRALSRPMRKADLMRACCT